MGNDQLRAGVAQLAHQFDGMLDALALDHSRRWRDEPVLLSDANLAPHIGVVIVQAGGGVSKSKMFGMICEGMPKRRAAPSGHGINDDVFDMMQEGREGGLEIIVDAIQRESLAFR